MVFDASGAHPAPPSRLTCSTCGRVFFITETSAPPFCSERCKLVDLGRWLDEDIGVPHEGGNEGREPPDPDDDPGGEI